MEKKSEIQKFVFESFDVRIVDRDGNPWFVAKDVCRVLGLSNTSKACETLDMDEKDTITFSDSEGKPHKLLIISESGLYHLIGKSRKPEAKTFSKWVRKEVLPSIRKTGSYSIQDVPVLSEMEMIHKMSGVIIEQQKQLVQHDQDIKSLKEKVDKLDRSPFGTRNKLSWIKKTTKKPPEISMRQSLNILMRSYVNETSGDHRIAWNNLYQEFKWRYSIDIKRRAKNRNTTNLKVVEEMGMMEDLYALAKELFLSTDTIDMDESDEYTESVSPVALKDYN